MIRRRLPLLAALLVVGASGCGESDDDSGTTQPSIAPAPATEPAPSTTVVPPSTITRPDVTSPTKDTTPDDPLPTSPEAPVTDPSNSSVPSGSNTEIAVTDLAGRLDIEPSEIEVLSVDEVTWPDGSLGCPEPGMSYTQALVNGQRIVLAVDGSEYEYHAGRGRDPFYCPADRATPPASGGGGYGDT